MTLAICLLFLASTAVAMPSETKVGKAFSLFNVINFPNDQCTTQMTSVMLGICVTSTECESRTGASASGNCASGFGVCCLTIISDPATKITGNMTYIQNEEFPSGFGASGTVAEVSRAYSIEGSSQIKQIRLDFETGRFAQPAAGDCTTDEITVTSPSTTQLGFAKLCGTLTGQHMYIPNDGADPAAILNIKTGASALSSGRQWKVLVRMLEAGNPSLAPEGCLQYFTGASGTITSFNDLALDGTSNGMTLDNLQYKACIRAAPGATCITYREARTTGTPDAFLLANMGAAEAAVSARGLNVIAATGVAADCETEAVIIRGTGTVGDYFCGGLLNLVNDQTTSGPVTSKTKPFGLEVFSDSSVDKLEGRFELVYSQSTC